MEMETRNLASAPSEVDLISFRQEMEPALQGDEQIQKTTLSSLIHQIDVTQDGQVGVKFYINTRALGITPYRSWIREDLYAVLEVVLLRWKIIRRNVLPPWRIVTGEGKRKSPLDCSAYEVSGDS